jgi:hypothetical protein
MHWRKFVSRAMPLFGLLAGCAVKDDAGRHSLSGTVIFGGQPVPAGQIIFEPDVAKGNDGPGGFAVIRQGRYQTEPDMGTVGGPNIARFTIGDGINPNGMQPYGKLLVIETITLEVDLPRNDGSLDLAIPEAPSKKGEGRRDKAD